VRLLGAIVAMAATVLVCATANYDPASKAVVMLVAIAKAVESVSDVVYGLLQRGERFRRIAFSMLAKGLGTLVLVGVILRLTRSLVVATIGIAALWALLLATIDLPAARRLARVWPHFDRATVASLTWLALPMGFVMSIGSLNANVPRYALEAHAGPAALGHFAAMAYLMVAATQPSIAFGVAASPRFAVAFVKDPRQFLSLSLRFVGQQAVLGSAALVGIVVAGPWILARAYGPDYASRSDVLFWLGVTTALSFVTSALGYTITAARRFKAQLLIAVASLAVCVVASYVLIPAFDLLGAAWAMLAAETSRLVTLGIVQVRLRRQSSLPMHEPEVVPSGPSGPVRAAV
jgi:O-antigen/teichoic acid export membrane protein